MWEETYKSFHDRSAISVINEETYDEKFSDVNLTDTNINLNTYLGESIAQLGVFTVTVGLNDKKNIA